MRGTAGRVELEPDIDAITGRDLALCDFVDLDLDLEREPTRPGLTGFGVAIVEATGEMPAKTTSTRVASIGGDSEGS